MAFQDSRARTEKYILVWCSFLFLTRFLPTLRQSKEMLILKSRIIQLSCTYFTLFSSWLTDFSMLQSQWQNAYKSFCLRSKRLDCSQAHSLEYNWWEPLEGHWGLIHSATSITRWFHFKHSFIYSTNIVVTTVHQGVIKTGRKTTQKELKNQEWVIHKHIFTAHIWSLWWYRRPQIVKSTEGRPNMHKREGFSEMMTFGFLFVFNTWFDKRVKFLNLHFKEEEIKTDKETVMQTFSDNYTVLKEACIDVLWSLEPCESMYYKQDDFQPIQHCSRSSVTVLHFENFYLILFSDPPLPPPSPLPLFFL